MKLTKFALAITLSLSCLLAPVKKAEAGFIIGMTGAGMPAALLMIGGAAAGIGSMVLEDRDNTLSNVVFFSGIAIMLLDTPTDTLSSRLAKEFPNVPGYIISEVSEVVMEKAQLIPFNPKGLKSVTLSRSEVSEIEAAMPRDVSTKELKAFRALLLTEIAL